VEVAFANNPIDLAGYRNTNLYGQPVSYWRMDNASSLIDQAGQRQHDDAQQLSKPGVVAYVGRLEPGASVQRNKPGGCRR
jgi:hypothetical protein